MKNKCLLLICILIICFMLVACDANFSVNTYNTLSLFSTNTTLQTILEKDSNVDTNKVWDEIKSTLSEIENNLSVYKENSDIYKFNNLPSGKIEVSKETYEIILTAKELYNMTNGLFDPSIFPLVDLWGFTDRHRESTFVVSKPYDRLNFKENTPEQKYIDAFKNLLKFDQIEAEVKDNKYYLIKPDVSVDVDGQKYYMQIDLGGIGKGLAVQKAKEILLEHKIERGYISCGISSVYCLKKDSSPYTIKFNNPRGEGIYMSIDKIDTSISTSGDYENYYEIAGKRYCHIIDPKTGYPIDNKIIAASVVCDNAIYGDALSTAICIGGIDLIKNLDKKYEVAVTYLGTENEKLIYTNSDAFKVEDKEYRLVNEHK